MIDFIVRKRISANPDVTYNQPEILLWAHVFSRRVQASFHKHDTKHHREAEVCMDLTCACIATLAPLARKRGPSRASHSILKGATARLLLVDPPVSVASSISRYPDSSSATITIAFRLKRGRGRPRKNS